MPLTQLVYFSRYKAAVASGGHVPLEPLRAILSVSQRNNSRNEVTGFLLFDQTWFFQVLEGERAPLVSTYERIQHDTRHVEVTLIALRDTRARSFPTWSMGGASRTVDQGEIFLRHGISGALDPARITAPTVIALAMDLQDHGRIQPHITADAAG